MQSGHTVEDQNECVLTRVGDTANNWDQKGFQVGLGVNLR
jgi:hypothetical protein